MHSHSLNKDQKDILKILKLKWTKTERIITKIKILKAKQTKAKNTGIKIIFKIAQVGYSIRFENELYEIYV